MSNSNPYWDNNFFEFFATLALRCLAWIRGDLPLTQLAPDEIQLLVLALVAGSCALVGSFLVLRQMAMLANSLSHTLLLGIVIAYMLFVPFGGGSLETITLPSLLVASLLTALFTTLLTQMLIHYIRLQPDASIGLVFTTLFALGIVLVTAFTRNTHIATEAVMGNCDALHLDDLKLVAVVLAIDLLVIVTLFKEFTLTTFDPGLARALGFHPVLFGYILMLLTAATTISAFRSVGVLLVLAFLVCPVLTARLLTHRLKPLIITSCSLAVFCPCLAVAISRHILSIYSIPLSTSGLTVCCMGLVYLAVILQKSIHRPNIGQKI